MPFLRAFEEGPRLPAVSVCQDWHDVGRHRHGDNENLDCNFLHDVTPSLLDSEQ
jgi:hypothetical protein